VGYRKGAALPNRFTAERADGRVEEFPNGKLSALRIGAGEAYVLESGGGGGYGSPLERPPERVRQDVIDGYVSAEAAYDAYGVVLDAETLTLDEAATARRREELAAAGGGVMPTDC
jgi:N-methylhydantoinase B